MTTFLHLGKHIINVEQVVSVRYLAPEAQREVIQYGERNIVKAKPYRVEITLTSLEWEHSWAGGDTPNGTGTQSQTITVSGELAEKTWLYFENRADIANLETVPA